MKLSTHAQELLARVRDRVTSTTARAEAPSPTRDPVVRRMDFDFEAGDVPRYWLRGSVVGTAIANALNLIFPDGERFFVRSVNHYIDQIEDPGLRERVKRFYGQEGQHAREHERFYEILRGHGYDIDAFLVPYRKLAYERIAPAVSPELRLAVTAALEHYTASFAEFAMTDGYVPALVPPVMAELLMWHAAEEIEHKDVAYDVLQLVDDRYTLRVAGMLVATTVLTGFWMQAIVTLLAQEKQVELTRLLGELATLPIAGVGPVVCMPRAFLQYLRPDFHPNQVPNDHLAVEYFESIGRSAA